MAQFNYSVNEVEIIIDVDKPKQDGIVLDVEFRDDFGLHHLLDAWYYTIPYNFDDDDWQEFCDELYKTWNQYIAPTTATPISKFDFADEITSEAVEQGLYDDILSKPAPRNPFERGTWNI